MGGDGDGTDDRKFPDPSSPWEIPRKIPGTFFPSTQDPTCRGQAAGACLKHQAPGAARSQSAHLRGGLALPAPAPQDPAGTCQQQRLSSAGHKKD